MPAHEVRVADPIEGGSESREGHKGRRRAQGSHNFLSFSFLGVLCKCLWEAPVSGKVDSFKCCHVSGLIGILLLYCCCCYCAFGVIAFGVLHCVLLVCD